MNCTAVGCLVRFNVMLFFIAMAAAIACAVDSFNVRFSITITCFVMACVAIVCAVDSFIARFPILNSFIVMASIARFLIEILCVMRFNRDELHGGGLPREVQRHVLLYRDGCSDRLRRRLV